MMGSAQKRTTKQICISPYNVPMTSWIATPDLSFAFAQHQRDMLHSNSKTQTWIFKGALYQDRTTPDPGLHSKSAASQGLSKLTFKSVHNFLYGLWNICHPKYTSFLASPGFWIPYEFTLPYNHNLSDENGLLFAFISQIQLTLFVQVKTPDLQFPCKSKLAVRHNFGNWLSG